VAGKSVLVKGWEQRRLDSPTVMQGVVGPSMGVGQGVLGTVALPCYSLSL